MGKDMNVVSEAVEILAPLDVKTQTKCANDAEFISLMLEIEYPDTISENAMDFCENLMARASRKRNGFPQIRQHPFMRNVGSWDPVTLASSNAHPFVTDYIKDNSFEDPNDELDRLAKESEREATLKREKERLKETEREKASDTVKEAGGEAEAEAKEVEVRGSMTSFFGSRSSRIEEEKKRKTKIGEDSKGKKQKRGAKKRKAFLSFDQLVNSIIAEIWDTQDSEKAEKSVDKWLAQPPKESNRLFKRWNYMSEEGFKLEAMAANELEKEAQSE